MSPGLGGNTVGAEDNTGRNSERHRVDRALQCAGKKIRAENWLELCWGLLLPLLAGAVSCGLVKSQEPITFLCFCPFGLGFYHFFPKRQRGRGAGEPLRTLGRPPLELLPPLNVVPSCEVLLWSLRSWWFLPPGVFFWLEDSICVSCFSAISVPEEQKLTWIVGRASEKTQMFLMPTQFPRA